MISSFVNTPQGRMHAAVSAEDVIGLTDYYDRPQVECCEGRLTADLWDSENSLYDVLKIVTTWADHDGHRLPPEVLSAWEIERARVEDQGLDPTLSVDDIPDVVL